MAGDRGLGGLSDQAAVPVSPRRWYVSLWKEPSALLGGAVLLTMALAALLAPRLAPFDPSSLADPDSYVGRSALPHSPPFWDRSGDAPFVHDPDDPFADFMRSLPYDPTFVLGTDGKSRDMLTLLLYGLRFSMPVGLLAVALVAVFGAALGLSAGWLGGWWDDLVTWVSDAAEAIPALLAYVVFAAFVSEPAVALLQPAGLSLDAVPVTILVLSCVGWAPVARLVRARVLELKKAEWVFAARAIGVRDSTILVRHVLSHTYGAMLVAASAQLPLMLLADGLLGAIGVGQRPSSDSLGELIFHEFPSTVAAPVFVLMPTFLVVTMSLALTALSDGVRKALDPQRIG